jgi:L,D-peptidoglycan transpeptidase YkuD (ErfK/YbiS/YcfS/YnhG family)
VKQLIASLVVVLVATALAVTPAAASAPAGPDAQPVTARSADTVRLGGVPVRLRPNTRQVVTVNRSRGHHARVTFWVRRQGTWHRVWRAHDGRIGYNGLVRPRKRVQGSGRTPLGTHRLPWAFGMRKQRPAWDPSYRRVRNGDYWVLDNRSDHYNRFRKKSQGGFRWWLDPGHPDASERLKDYPKQYEFAVVTSFNAGQVRHRGGAIFLHVNGSGATAGCVSAPRWFLRRVVSRLDQDRVPVIAIGR